MKKSSLLIAVLLAALFTGCASFKPTRSARFIDMDSNIIKVEYGEELHDDTLPDGRKFSFKGKIRVTLPDGKKVYLYQGLTETGNLYHNYKKDYHYLEKGPCCFMSHNGDVIFQGYYGRDFTKPDKNDKKTK